MRKSRKPWTTKAALTNAVIWTFAAAIAILNFLLGVRNAFLVVIILVFTATAVLDWITYVKKRQEEQNHE